jgi:hypothetical protein
MSAMPQEPTGPKRPAESAEDDVEKFLNEQKAIESKRHDLIKEVLRQKEAAIKVFDDKLEKLGYDGEHTKRSHHTKHGEKKAE